MTIKEIKPMFSPGQSIRVTREGFQPTVIHGNLGATSLPPSNYIETRTVTKVGSIDLVTRRPDGRDSYAKWPKAGEVIDAKPGLLHWRYAGQQGTIKFEITP